MKPLFEKNHPTLSALKQYLEDNLSFFNKHRVERHLLKCESCFEKVDGLKQALKKKSELTGTKKAA